MFDGGNDDCYRLKTNNHQQYQTNSDKKVLPPNEYLEKIRPDLIQLINNLENSRIQVTMHIVFNSTRNLNEKRTYTLKQNLQVLMKCLAH